MQILQTSCSSDRWESRENAVGWCHTNVHVKKSSYTWTISNFSMLTGKVESSIFSTGDNDQLEWRLMIYPSATYDEEFVGVFLQLVSSPRPEVAATYEFSIINALSEKANVRVYEMPNKFLENEVKGDSMFIESSQLRKSPNLLPKDKLTLFVEITVITHIVNITKRVMKLPVRVPECQLINEMESLVGNQHLSDVVFNVSGREVPGHKSILATRSPVFAAMFQQDMTENQTGRVEVSDIEVTVFMEMLHYIYTGKVPNLYTLAEGLLEAAEKYDLKRLKALSESAMCQTLKIENGARRLLLADFYNADRLKSLAIDFINTHAREVMATRGFITLVTTRPELITDVFFAAASGREIPRENKNKKGILDVMLLLPENFIETKIVVFIYWVGRRHVRRFFRKQHRLLNLLSRRYIFSLS